jgi:hypothetical protein
MDAIEAALLATDIGNVINTAYIERLNATFRARLTGLVRRTQVSGAQAGVAWSRDVAGGESATTAPLITV